MNTKIFVRQKVDWDFLNGDFFYIQDKNSPINKINQSNFDLPSFWKKIFKISFFQFRKTMQSISREQHKLTNCEVIIGEDDLKKEFEIEEDCYIAPVDDDDFFCPEIKQYLDPCKKDIVLWPEGWMCGLKVFRSRPPSRGTGTNTYAIKKSFLKSINYEKSYKVLRYHGAVQKTLFQNLSVEEFINGCEFINSSLSVSNRHIGTITLWQNLIFNKFDVFDEILSRYYEYLFCNKLSLSGYEWCKKCAYKNYKSHQKLLCRKTLLLKKIPNNFKLHQNILFL